MSSVPGKEMHGIYFKKSDWNWLQMISQKTEGYRGNNSEVVSRGLALLRTVIEVMEKNDTHTLNINLLCKAAGIRYDGKVRAEDPRVLAIYESIKQAPGMHLQPELHEDWLKKAIIRTGVSDARTISGRIEMLTGLGIITAPILKENITEREWNKLPKEVKKKVRRYHVWYPQDWSVVGLGKEEENAEETEHVSVVITEEDQHDENNDEAEYEAMMEKKRREALSR